MWKALEYNLSNITKLVYVCASLHNRFVDRWLAKRNDLQPKPQSNYARICCANEDILSYGDDFPCDEAWRNQLENQCLHEQGHGAGGLCDRREQLKESIYHCGIRFDHLAEVEFVYDDECDAP